MAEQLQSSTLPIDVLPLGEDLPRTLDAGCIKIAQHAGFIRELRDGSSGAVEELELSWRAAAPP
jgi:hypothetical protein